MSGVKRTQILTSVLSLVSCVQLGHMQISLNPAYSLTVQKMKTGPPTVLMCVSSRKVVSQAHQTFCTLAGPLLMCTFNVQIL